MVVIQYMIVDVTQPPVSDDIAAAFALFYAGGGGPSHTKLTSAFTAGGYQEVPPFKYGAPNAPNKQDRILRAMREAIRCPRGARTFVDRLLVDLRIDGFFDEDEQRGNVQVLQRAFRKTGWDLSDDGYLTSIGPIDLTTGGREALDEQLLRLRRATDDPGQSIGTAKDLLEAVAKFVLEEVGAPLQRKADFSELWHHARDRLGILPGQVAENLPGAKHIKAVLQSAWTIAEQINMLRNIQGAGHGHTLPTGVTAEVAQLMVREACSVAEFTLATLDRQYGHARRQ